MDLKRIEWNESYEHKDNVLFYPHEEIIRFISKNIRKRIEFNKFLDIRPNFKKVLDLGCGMGRHVFYLDEMGFEAFGIDLSTVAIKKAKEISKLIGKTDLANNFTVGDITDMTFDSDMFDFVVSHGVLDSMHFSIALLAMKETARVLRPGGLFYFDLIMDSEFSDAEVIVNTKHEFGTVQSYFNNDKISKLLGNKFNIVDFSIIERHEKDMELIDRRAHLVCERIH
jgi:SAM-dependent methyltransferase